MNPCNQNKLLLILGHCLLGLGCLSLLISGEVFATESDRDQQAEIEAGHWVDDPQKGFQVFSQGVDLVQGSLHIQAQKATVYQGDDNSTFSRIILEGQPARWSEELDDGSEMNAQANHIDYNMSNDTVILRGDVIINKDGDRISGDLIRYNLDTQMLRAGGEGRVKMRVSPKKKPGSDTP